MAKQTPFYLKRLLSINVAYSRLERDLFGPWMLFHSGKEITITNCEGKEVSLTGDGEYAGSLQETFWGGFCEPDFKKLIKEQIDHTIKDCESSPEFVKSALREIADLLKVFSRKAYERMAEIDARIRGNGDPNIVERRPVEDKIKALNTDIDVSIEEARKRLKSSMRWLLLPFFKKSMAS